MFWMNPILDEPDGGALRREFGIAPDADGIGPVGEKVGRKIGRGAVQLDVLDAAGELHLEPVREFELVEEIAGDAPVRVRVEEAAEGAGGVARRRKVLMPGLHAERGGQGGEPQVDRQERDFDPALLLLVGERLANSVAGGIRRVGQAELVVLVVGCAEPEADRIDAGGLRPILALAQHLGLLRVDARVVILPVDARDVIRGVALDDGGADEALIEYQRAADRSTLAVNCGIRLHAREKIRLRRTRGQKRVGGNEIRITWDAVIARRAAIGVGVEGEIAGAGVEQHPAFEAVVDRGGGASGLQAEPARRDRLGNAVVGRAHDAADRLRTPAQGGRAAHHLDLVGRQRIDRHEVVLAQVRGAAAADAVLQDADTIDVEAADDRAAGSAGRKARAGDAGLVEQHVAERAAAVAPDLFVRHHRDRGELIGDDGERSR